ncbi:MAG: MoaF N-terminal domain-containing protein [Planctomycetes bacterium]|nr:MoaF N-terminal domain-containing protein [Planctomycetota bacterium]
MAGTKRILGRTYDFLFSPRAMYRLHFVDDGHVDVTVMADPTYPKGTVNHYETQMTEIRPDVYLLNWLEPATGNCVTHVGDFAKNISHTSIIDLVAKGFWRLRGIIRPLA